MPKIRRRASSPQKRRIPDLAQYPPKFLAGSRAVQEPDLSFDAIVGMASTARPSSPAAFRLGRVGFGLVLLLLLAPREQHPPVLPLPQLEPLSEASHLMPWRH